MESVPNRRLSALFLDTSKFRMCQNNHFVVNDLCAKFYANQS